MVYYTCEKCDYMTKDKSRFERHLNKKNPCYSKDTHLVFSPEIFQKPSQNPHKPSQNPHKSSQIQTKSQNENGCIYCGKIFKRKDNLKRHMELYCKIMKWQMDELESKKSNWENEKLELETKTIELEKKVEQLNHDLINKPQQIITNNIDNSQNIKINNYGSENLDYLTIKGINQLIETPYIAIQKLIEYVHYHPNHPENNNMKITNKKEPYIKLLEDNKWKLENKKNVLEGLIDKSKIILDRYRDEELHSEFKNECYNKFSNKIENDDKELIKQMIKDLELLIINNS